MSILIATTGATLMIFLEEREMSSIESDEEGDGTSSGLEKSLPCPKSSPERDVGAEFSALSRSWLRGGSSKV